MPSFEFSYDRENDILFLSKKGAMSKGAIEWGDLILDFDYQKKLVGIQIMNAVDFLAEMADVPRDSIEKMLSRLEHCEVESRQHRNTWIIKVILVSKLNERMRIPLSAPSLTTHSPALGFA